MAEPSDVLLGPGASFDGLAVFEGDVRVDGHLRGRVIGTGTLWVGTEGRVEARIEADEVVVAGEVIGEVRAGRRIELRSTARVRAALAAPRLVLEEGSVFEGRCSAGAEAGPSGAALASRAVS